MTPPVRSAHDHKPSKLGAEGLLLWISAATLAVTMIIIIGITQFDAAAAGVAIALGSLIVAAVGVLAYIMRFIDSEE